MKKKKIKIKQLEENELNRLSEGRKLLDQAASQGKDPIEYLIHLDLHDLSNYQYINSALKIIDPEREKFHRGLFNLFYHGTPAEKNFAAKKLYRWTQDLDILHYLMDLARNGENDEKEFAWDFLILNDEVYNLSVDIVLHDSDNRFAFNKLMSIVKVTSDSYRVYVDRAAMNEELISHFVRLLKSGSIYQESGRGGFVDGALFLGRVYKSKKLTPKNKSSIDSVRTVWVCNEDYWDDEVREIDERGDWHFVHTNRPTLKTKTKTLADYLG